MKTTGPLEHLPLFVEKMKRENISASVIETFEYYYRKAANGELGLLFDKDILPVSKEEITDAQTLSPYAGAGKKAMDRAAVIVLNGGLGTSMGMIGPKSLLPVKNGKSFLQVILDRAQKNNNTLVLMNSFNTHQATLSAVKDLPLKNPPMMFLQNRFPKVLQDGFAPATWPQNTDLEWNPPGHGDIYTALHATGTLDNLLEKGVDYAFVCNADNLGASLDPALLGYFSENEIPFMMEVSDRTPSDKKGGHLAKTAEKDYILRETAQCPVDEMAAFTDIRKYCYFNTNNLWINLISLKKYLEETSVVKLPMILNAKTLDPRDKASPKIYQIETAMGAAISLFYGASAVKSPRTRFYPVKTCNELIAIRSDRFVLSDEGTVVDNPDRSSDGIKINLDPQFFGSFDQLDARFREGIPSLIHCESLTIKGDVSFGTGIKIVGHVKIENTRTPQVRIEDGKVIDGDLTF